MRIRITDRARAGDAFGIGTHVIETKHAAKFVVAAFIFVFVLFAGVGWAIKTFAGQNAALMAQGAVEVAARVDGVNSERRQTDGRTTYSYRADLSYVDAAGKSWRQQVSIGQSDYQQWQIGQTVPLRYAAADPSVIELHAGDLAGGAAIGGWLMMGGIAGLVLTVAVALFRGRRKAEVI